MDKIKVMCLNGADDFRWNRMLMKLGANMSMHGPRILNRCLQNPEHLRELLEIKPSEGLIKKLVALPHVTLQKFVNFQIVVFGASRRFLAQITRHQNDVKFMSMSLHYSDVSDENISWVTPRSMTPKQAYNYMSYCDSVMHYYKTMCGERKEKETKDPNMVFGPGDGADHNDAAYVLPQGMRNVIMISANAWQWRHMIKQRICNRNTDEMRYAMLLCWKALYDMDSIVFEDCWPDCCAEGDMSCGEPLTAYKDHDIISGGLSGPYVPLSMEFSDLPWNGAVVS